MSKCVICGRSGPDVAHALKLCARCVLADSPAARERAAKVHRRARGQFDLPGEPPRCDDGARCRFCANACAIAQGETGFCGVRRNADGVLSGGDASGAAVSWYRDPLPTNCVADWVCPASTPAGHPAFTDTEGPEYGYHNLAVFYEACSFDCLFCQNWHFKYNSLTGPRRTAGELAAAADSRTRCICFFGGDPSCQVEHALTAAREARENAAGRILRICWETNGSVARSYLEEMAALSLETGGCIKFDLKARDEPLHRALTGASNRATLANFAHLAGHIASRPEPPFLIAATLLVPGYIDAAQVAGIARFIADLNEDIPYALLAFHPGFEMMDLPTTSKEQAFECLEAARAAGLTRVRIGNVHLLR